jgi:hypothetical protein
MAAPLGHRIAAVEFDSIIDGFATIDAAEIGSGRRSELSFGR